MPKIETEIREIRHYFETWVTQVKTAVSLGLFDTNKISEGTSRKLLNLVFGYNLENLNREKNNYPGIDLGDRQNAKLAFQITSRSDTGKIKDSLKTFVEKNYANDFPNGLRFFIINDKRLIRLGQADLAEYGAFFDVKNHILFPDTLISEIAEIYYSDQKRYKTIKAFLAQEFGQSRILTERNFLAPLDKINLFKELYIAENERYSVFMVPFECKFEDVVQQTSDLNENLFQLRGLTLTGPSGCGKSILARHLGLLFLKSGITLVLEAKYYENDLFNFLEKSISGTIFEGISDFISFAAEQRIQLLFIVDGLNELDQVRRKTLLMEIQKISNLHQIKLIVTAQKKEDLSVLPFSAIEIDYPTFEVKMAIAALYNGSNHHSKIEALLKVVLTGLEAKIVGEISSAIDEKLSKLDMFEIFLSQKFESQRANCFALLSKLAMHLSESLSYSVRKYVVDQILSSEDLPIEVYRECISSKILEESMGKVSFTHEMILNFFVAIHIGRTYEDPQVIIQSMNSPKNHELRLLILGSIDRYDVLSEVLKNLTDNDLFFALYMGEGGEYCKKWVERKLTEIYARIEDEINGLEYKIDDTSPSGMEFDEHTLQQWTTQDWALISTIPMLLVKEVLIDEFFNLVSAMENRRMLQEQKLTSTSKRKSLSSSTFSATFVGLSATQPAITRMFTQLASGFVTFAKPAEIKSQTIQRILLRGSLNDGHFYLIMLLLRYQDKLSLIYSYVEKTLKERWKTAPYHLKLEILHQIRHFAQTEDQHLSLVSTLEKILPGEDNPWISTTVFEALDSLNALDVEADAHIESVKEQLKNIIARSSDEMCWMLADGVYNAQFDHPYSSAYLTAIDSLSSEEKSTFYAMALRGAEPFMLTVSLILEAAKHMRSEVSPYLLKWTAKPFSDPSFQQDSLHIFFLSHVILGKNNYSLTSRLSNLEDELDRSLHATAELYYWLNRSEMPLAERKRSCKPGTDVLFRQNNQYAVDSIWESEILMIRSSTYSIFKESPITFITENFQDQVVAVSRRALEKPDEQMGIIWYNKRREVIDHAISLITKHGSLLDVGILTSFAEDPEHGRSAVSAIRELTRKP